VPRNRYTQLIHEQERLHIVWLEKRLTVLVRELHSGVVMPVDLLPLLVEPKASREIRRQQKFQHHAELADSAAGSIPA
jgi:hypothetical protein